MTKKSLMIGSLALGFFGCATPKELVDARSTYERVAAGPTATVNPNGLAQAREALVRAEGAYKREVDSNVHYFPGAADSPDLAYVAQRKALIAEAEANATLAANEKARLNKELEQKNLARRKSEDEREAEKRRLADQAAAEAAAKLASVGEVKQEARGTVLTMAGSVVFASGKATLRGEAQDKLKKVAATLKEISSRTFLVEGHTDSVGSDEMNLKLSDNRAAAVRNFLIRQGVKGDQIRAVGKGKSTPVSDNETTEGRAKNRRVEIIIEANKG